MKSKKRFIAGATCPLCQSLDTLRWWQVEHVEMVECVHCGHLDRRSPKQAPDLNVQSGSSQVIGIFKPE